MTESAGVIIQLPAGSAVDRQLTDVPPPSVADHRTVVERIAADAAGRIEPPAAGQVVLTFLSPEALSRWSASAGLARLRAIYARSLPRFDLVYKGAKWPSVKLAGGSCGRSEAGGGRGASAGGREGP